MYDYPDVPVKCKVYQHHLLGGLDQRKLVLLTSIIFRRRNNFLKNTVCAGGEGFAKKCDINKEVKK